jgi:hypothetical protein
MWHQRSSRKDLEEIILRRVREYLREEYNDPKVKGSAELSAHDFAYCSASKTKIRDSYVGLVNEGVEYVMGKIRRDRK